MRAFFSTVFEKAGTTIVVALVLAILGATAAYLSGGQLIEMMGGVSAREFGKKFDKKLGEQIADENTGLLRRSKFAEFSKDLDGRIVNLERKLKTLEETSLASDEEADKVLSALKQSPADMTDIFDGAARIVYFREDIAICADGGCGTPLPSNFPEQSVKLGLGGTRTWPIQIGAAQNLREPFTILTSWSKIIENEFVALGGGTQEVTVTLEEKNDAIEIAVGTAPYDGETYMVIQVHYLVAIEDSISLTTE